MSTRLTATRCRKFHEQPPLTLPKRKPFSAVPMLSRHSKIPARANPRAGAVAGASGGAGDAARRLLGAKSDYYKPSIASEDSKVRIFACAYFRVFVS